MAKRLVIIISLMTISAVFITLVAGNDLKDKRDRAFAGAAGTGNIRKMQALRLLGADINRHNQGTVPALIAAAHNGHIDGVRYLLNKGANVNIHANGGWSALISASEKDHLDIVKLLVARGAEINSVGDDGSALRVALTRGNTDVASYLKGIGAKECTADQRGNCGTKDQVHQVQFLPMRH